MLVQFLSTTQASHELALLVPLLSLLFCASSKYVAHVPMLIPSRMLRGKLPTAA